MTAFVRLPRALHAQVSADLRRPHPYAAERMGFLYARWVRAGGAYILLAYEYNQIADDHYIPDEAVGARINGNAIRRALQTTLNEQASCFHVHAHAPRFARFSQLDLAEQERLIPSFVATVSDSPHGALLLAGNAAVARIWLPGCPVPEFAAGISTIGFPMSFSWGG